MSESGCLNKWSQAGGIALTVTEYVRKCFLVLIVINKVRAEVILVFVFESYIFPLLIVMRSACAVPDVSFFCQL